MWDAILPAELLVLPAELGRIDVPLDDPVFFAPFATHFDARIGRVASRHRRACASHAAGPFAATPRDVLLASAGVGLLTRVVLPPVTSWSGASSSSVMPLAYEGGVWWLRARMASGMDGAGLSLDTITDRIGRGGAPFDVEQANGTGGFRPLARLSLDEVIPTDDPASDVSFDPTLHCPPGVKLLPGWLTDFRRLAYRRSRRAEEHRGAFKLAVAGRNQTRPLPRRPTRKAQRRLHRLNAGERGGRNPVGGTGQLGIAWSQRLPARITPQRRALAAGDL